jgi:flagellar biosynthesis protein FliQ
MAEERGRMAKMVYIVFFAGSSVFLILALVLALTKGVLDVSVLDFYFVVLPRYLLLIAAIFFTADWIMRRLALPHP